MNQAQIWRILNLKPQAALAAAVWLACAPWANAQLSSGRGPISYSADNLEYNDQEQRLVLTGNVDVLQNDARMQANKLTLFFRKKAPDEASGVKPAKVSSPSAPSSLGSGDIDRIIAEGDVHFVRPMQKARGDHAVYEASTDTVTFTGNVVISSDENVIRGETLVMVVGSGHTTLAPANKPGERVRGVLHPKDDGADKGKSTGL